MGITLLVPSSSGFNGTLHSAGEGYQNNQLFLRKHLNLKEKFVHNLKALHTSFGNRLFKGALKDLLIFKEKHARNIAEQIP